MCGISGIFSPVKKAIPAGKAKLLMEQLRHRGPDGQRVWQNDHALMVHDRLSIIDLSDSGSQPFLSEDQKIVAIVNGEIYNYKSLRASLITKGYKFKGTSDCEMIPFLFQEWGISFCQMIEGMFAIALYDQTAGRLYLIRDRFGIKPLYYHAGAEFFYFGSELKAVLCNPEIKRIADKQDIYDFISFCYVPEPKTGFKEIYAVRPGSFLEVSRGGPREEVYWNIDDVKPSKINYDEACDRTRAKLDDAVRSQLVSDAPLGAFLSGGIDSAAVVTTMKRVNPSKKFKTFTVKFPDIEYDESEYAKVISDQVGTEHHLLTIHEGQGDPQIITRILSHFDQPFGDSSAIPTFLISREIGKYVKVALSGDGGDEILGGYNTFWYYDYIRRIARIPRFVRHSMIWMLKAVRGISPDKSRQLIKLLSFSFLSPQELIFRLSSYVQEEEKGEIFNAQFHRGFDKKSTSRWFCSFHDKSTDDDALAISKMLFKLKLPSQMFKKVDVMSMYASIEVRVPLMDEALVSLALSLPRNFKIRNKTGKFILRDLLQEELPKMIVQKKKTGFGIPLDKLINPELMEFIRQRLTAPESEVRRIVNEQTIAQWIDAFEAKNSLKEHISREGLYQRIFMLLSLDIWLTKYKPKWE